MSPQLCHTWFKRCVAFNKRLEVIRVGCKHLVVGKSSQTVTLLAFDITALGHACCVFHLKMEAFEIVTACNSRSMSIFVGLLMGFAIGFAHPFFQTPYCSKIRLMASLWSFLAINRSMHSQHWGTVEKPCSSGKHSLTCASAFDVMFGLGSRTAKWFLFELNNFQFSGQCQ